MGNYLSPGLFLEERSASAGPVAGVSTSTYASAGWLRKGPENQPQLVTSFQRFVEIFGTYWRNSYIPFIVASFLQNEGTRAYITRIVPSNAVKASNASCFSDAASAAEFIGRALPATTDLSTDKNINLAIDGGVAADIDASAGAAVPAAVTPAEMQAAIDVTVGITCTLLAGDRLKIVSDNPGADSALLFAVATANDNTAKILGLDVSGSKTYTYTGEAASDWGGEAAWNGAYYDQVRMCLSGNDDFQDGNGGWTKYNAGIDEESAVGAGDWDSLETYDGVVLDDDTDDYFIGTVINDATQFFKITEGATFNAPRVLRAAHKLAEWLAEGTGALASFSGTLLNTGIHPGSVSIVAAAITAVDDGEGNLSGTGITSGTIDYSTGAWTLVFTVAPVADVQILATYYVAATATSICCQLSGGSDGTGGLSRALVSDPALEASKSGIYAFNALDEILILTLPDFAGDVTVSNDLIAYAQNQKNRFCPLTTPLGKTPTQAASWLRNVAQYNTSYAALYYPWVKIYDPIADDGRLMNVPPDGFIAGAYARTDSRRNVGKAPGGITDGAMVGARGLEYVMDKGERDVVYQTRINPLIESTQTGRAVWGVKTLSLDAEWALVNVRRLFMFCEQSIYNSLFWAVFENNGPGLWAKVKAQGDGFFSNIFRDGYLAGTSPSQAWQIVVDESNNPPEAVDAGLLTVDYYIAPNKPAEFIRLRFQQKVNV